MRSAIGACCIFLATLGCAMQPPAASVTRQAEMDVLARSSPADGATAPAPVNALQLWFAKPARLIEVTLDGPDGQTPMMITALAETTYYEIPLPGLTGGKYRVNWRASASGQSHGGVLEFTVRN